MQFLLQEVTPNHLKGRVQAYLNVGRTLGLAVFAQVFGAIADRGSWVPVFAVAAVLLLPNLLLLRWVSAASKATPFSWDAYKLFQHRHVAGAVGYVVLSFYSAGEIRVVCFFRVSRRVSHKPAFSC